MDVIDEDQKSLMGQNCGLSVSVNKNQRMGR